MKKGLKNTIMIVMALVLVGTSAITYSYASEKSHPTAQPGFMQELPDKGNSQDGNRLPDFEQQKPDRGSSNQMPKQNDNQQPPAQNGSDANGNATGEQPSQDNQQNETDQTETAAEADAEFEAMAKGLNGGQQNLPQRGGRDSLISLLCYAFLAVQVGIILLIIIYLILSKFNTLTYKQAITHRQTVQKQ